MTALLIAGAIIAAAIIIAKALGGNSDAQERAFYDECLERVIMLTSRTGEDITQQEALAIIEARLKALYVIHREAGNITEPDPIPSLQLIVAAYALECQGMDTMEALAHMYKGVTG